MAAMLRGIGVSPGVAAGPVEVMTPAPTVPETIQPRADAAEELATVSAAFDDVAADLEARAGRASGVSADVLTAQSLMARDPVLAGKVAERVRAGAAGSHAVVAVLAEFRTSLENAGGYLAERAADLDDLRDRIVARLLGAPMPGLPDPGHAYILVARDLAPADTAMIDRAQVLAIVTEQGGPTSHTAILAKSMGVPAVVACPDALTLRPGELVLVDGASGEISRAPDAVAVASAQAREATRRAAAGSAVGPGHTADGHPVKLLVNLGTDSELLLASSADSEGVGLFRTEFLYLDRATAPTVDEQRAVYERVFAAFGGKKVVVRTLDAGADKPLRFAAQPAEPNPALGVRGLRIAARLPELLDTQLQAIAAAQGGAADVWVMAPMVSTPAEAAAFADQAHAAGLPIAGVMVEVPAAALRASALLAGCDFVSLGTNDLAQYTFAADRTLSELAGLLDPWQPALLELVARTAEAGKAVSKPVGVCGEAASDPLLALVLVGLGVTSLSMAPVSLGAVRAELAQQSLAACQEMASLALGADNARAAREGVATLAVERRATPQRA
ncbi:MAG: phosphoenolpyruvate--protein phosphotransferase [Thermoleophilia bacterium]